MRDELIERAKAGDRDAFGQLASMEVDRLYAIARLILRDADLAHDAVQEALIRCWRQLPKLRDVARFDGWLYRITVRAALDESSSGRRFKGAIQQLRLEPNSPDESRNVESRDELDIGLARLSVNHRTVVVLHHYVDLPLPQVAAILGISLGTAQSRYHYAISSLRAALEADQRLTAAEGVR